AVGNTSPPARTAGRWKTQKTRSRDNSGPSDDRRDIADVTPSDDRPKRTGDAPDPARVLLLPVVSVLILMADITDRLERMNKRDELTRRVLAQRALPDPVAELGADFVEVVEAVVVVVRRQPGPSGMVGPGDGRARRE